MNINIDIYVTDNVGNIFETFDLNINDNDAYLIWKSNRKIFCTWNSNADEIFVNKTW